MINKIYIFFKKNLIIINFIFYIVLFLLAGLLTLKILNPDKFIKNIEKKQKEYNDKMRELKKQENEIEKNKVNRHINISARNKKLGI
jgi:uncharacterized membrane protein (DUF106 family)